MPASIWKNTVLLRCLDTDSFALPGGPPLTSVALAEHLAAMHPSTSAHQAEPPVLDVLLPAERCLVTTVPVAKHEARLLSRTLPWTLEDRLLEPAEALHFGTGVPQQDNAAVCAVSSTWLRDMLDTLAAVGLYPRSLTSELLQLNWEPGQWTVLIPAASASPCLVRHGRSEGFACASANLSLALQLLLNESASQPGQVVVCAEAAASVDPTLFPALLQTRLRICRRDYWQCLQSELAGLNICNLLQGSFAPRLPLARWWRQWKFVALLVLGLFISDLTVTVLETRRLDQQQASHAAELLTLYRSVQPDGVVVDPRLQMQQAVTALGGSVHPGFLSLLSRIGPVLAAQPEASVQSLDYSDATGELGLLVATDGFAAAETLRVSLQALGLRAELLGSSSDGNRSLTRLQVVSL